MSDKSPIPLIVADRLAADVVSVIAPYCERCEVAGSIRRRVPTVGDIEVVAIPTMAAMVHDLFGVGIPPAEYTDAFSRAVVSLGAVLKGDPVKGKYVKISLECHVSVDLFLARPDNWGLIFGIRTGSADFVRQVLALGWVENGYHSIDGMLHRSGVPLPVRSEEELFELSGVPWVPPEKR
jgi:DNA polymerase/3'-5' exonuclease PolX